MWGEMYSTFEAAKRAGQASPLDYYPEVPASLFQYWQIYMDCSTQRDFNGAIRFEAVKIYLDEIGVFGRQRSFAFQLVIQLDSFYRKYRNENQGMKKESLLAGT